MQYLSILLLLILAYSHAMLAIEDFKHYEVDSSLVFVSHAALLLLAFSMNLSLTLLTACASLLLIASTEETTWNKVDVGYFLIALTTAVHCKVTLSTDVCIMLFGAVPAVLTLIVVLLKKEFTKISYLSIIAPTILAACACLVLT